MRNGFAFVLFLVAPIAIVAACGGANTSDFLPAAGAGGDASSAVTPDGDSTSGGEQDGSASDASVKHDSSAPGKDAASSDTSASPETSTQQDSSVDEGIFCGVDTSSQRTYCDSASQNCCVRRVSGGDLDFSCKPKTGAGSTCSGLSVPCSDQTDCGGKICCAAYNNVDRGYSSVACQDACSIDNAFTTEIRLCDPNAAVDECTADNRSCQPSDAIPGWYICK